jgi:hypothetical protein
MNLNHETFLEQICIKLGEEEKIPAMMKHFLPKVKALRDVEKEYMTAEIAFFEALGDGNLTETTIKKDILKKKIKKLKTIRWNTDRNIESNIKEVAKLEPPWEKTPIMPTDSPNFVPRVSRPRVSGPRVSGPRVSRARVSGPRVSGPRVSRARVSGPRVSRPREGKQYESKYTESKSKTKTRSRSKTKTRSRSKTKTRSKTKSKSKSKSKYKKK